MPASVDRRTLAISSRVENWESQHQEHQDDADLGPHFDEVRRRRQLDETALGEAESHQQVQRKRRQPDSAGETGDDRQAQHHFAPSSIINRSPPECMSCSPIG